MQVEEEASVEESKALELELKDYASFSTTRTTLGLPVEQAAHELWKNNVIGIENFLDSALLAAVMKIADQSSYGPFKEGEGYLGVEQEPRKGTKLLSLLVQRPEYRNWLETIGAAGRMSSIGGEIYQIQPTPNDFLGWHSDLATKERRLAMVIYLGAAPHGRRRIQLRYKNRLLLTYKYWKPGSALIFRIHPDLTHQVKPITSGGPRRVYSAWALARNADEPFARLSNAEEN